MTNSQRMRDKAVMISSTDAVGEIVLLWVAAHVLEGQHGDRRLVGKGGGGPRRDGFSAEAHAIHPHGPRDILQLLLAGIVKGEVQLVAHLVANAAADADAARLGQSFQPRRDVDAIAVDVVAVEDDIADVDAHTEFDPSVVGEAGIALDRSALKLDGAAHRIDDARKLNQHPIPGGLDDPSVMFVDLGVEQGASKRFQACKGSLLVGAHEPAIAFDIDGDDNRELAFDALLDHDPSQGAVARVILAQKWRSERHLRARFRQSHEGSAGALFSAAGRPSHGRRTAAAGPGSAPPPPFVFPRLSHRTLARCCRILIGSSGRAAAFVRLDYQQEYRDRGFTVVRGVFRPDEVAQMAAAFDRIRVEGLHHRASYRHQNVFFRLGTDARLGRILRLVQWPSYFDATLDAVRLDGRMIDILAPLIGSDLKQIINQMHWKTPGAASVEFAFHQDIRFRRPRTAFRDLAASYVQTGIAIDRHTPEAGCMRIVPGSHRLGEIALGGTGPILDQRASEAELGRAGLEPAGLVDLVLEPGDVALWHLLTIHGSGPNRSSADRRFYINGYVVAGNADRGVWAFRGGRPCPLGEPVLIHYEDLHRRPGPFYLDAD